MLCEDMHMEITMPGVLPPTVRTFKGHIPRMLHPVDLQIAELGRLVITEVARERLFPGVGSQMTVEIALVSRPVATLGACEGFLVSVLHEVTLDVGDCGGTVVTQSTVVDFYTELRLANSVLIFI